MTDLSPDESASVTKEEVSELMQVWEKLPLRARTASDLLVFLEMYLQGSANVPTEEFLTQLMLASIKLDLRLAEVEEQLEKLKSGS